MRQQLIQYSPGNQKIEEYGPFGGYVGPSSNIIWCWDKDGEPPISLDLGYMERVERAELLKDENGKQQYDKIETGDNKYCIKKAPIRQIVAYLKNNKTGKVGKSKKPPVRLPPE